MQEFYATVKMTKGKKIFQLKPTITPGSPKWLHPNRVQKLLLSQLSDRGQSALLEMYNINIPMSVN